MSQTRLMHLALAPSVLPEIAGFCAQSVMSENQLAAKNLVQQTAAVVALPSTDHTHATVRWATVLLIVCTVAHSFCQRVQQDGSHQDHWHQLASSDGGLFDS